MTACRKGREPSSEVWHGAKEAGCWSSLYLSPNIPLSFICGCLEKDCVETGQLSGAKDHSRDLLSK